LGGNREHIFGRNAEGRNANSYCPISGGMPKTGGSGNQSVSVAKKPKVCSHNNTPDVVVLSQHFEEPNQHHTPVERHVAACGR